MASLAHETSVEGGFADPVFDAQAVFRAVMDAFARPGTIADLGDRVAAPPTLVPAGAAFLAALADGDTPVWLEDRDGGAAERWLAFQTGAPVVADPAGATFAVLRKGSPVAGWDRFPCGTAEYPDRSATLLLAVDALEGGSPLSLEGPGIDGTRPFAPAGPPEGFHEAMAANRARFPQGLDLVLVCGSRLLALPRTTRIGDR